MKKTGLLNKDLSEVIAGLGHLDMLTVGDAGLPVPDGVRRIDLALCKGVPGFLETVETIVSELQVERIIVAEETASTSPRIESGLQRLFGEIPWEKVSHEQFKVLTARSRAIVRTGEFTPYANVILVSGVVF